MKDKKGLPPGPPPGDFLRPKRIRRNKEQLEHAKWLELLVRVHWDCLKKREKNDALLYAETAGEDWGESDSCSFDGGFKDYLHLVRRAFRLKILNDVELGLWKASKALRRDPRVLAFKVGYLGAISSRASKKR